MALFFFLSWCDIRIIIIYQITQDELHVVLYAPKLILIGSNEDCTFLRSTIYLASHL